MKKVVIAVDYNPASEAVVFAGYQLAKQLHADVCLLHVVSEGHYYGVQYPSFLGYDGFSMPVNYELQESLVSVAKDFVQKAAKHLNDDTVKTHIAEGDTAQTILEYCDSNNIELLIMGTHGHSTLEKLLVGTVAQTVLEKTKIPVYMVPIKKNN